ncbi:hypothetical protein [Bordetella sp. BOR01]|uniref:hypothetical protein n=1 Tax=Bordetella sp. BOR01 TaxID=2854779 RepID=UPI001C44105E|nr:hypothetical protein [Bordetella sp. BOR01]MBV7482188.1 hypothetical protein [Bordetella sp. BOR01]
MHLTIRTVADNDPAGFDLGFVRYGTTVALAVDLHDLSGEFESFSLDSFVLLRYQRLASHLQQRALLSLRVLDERAL